MNSIIYLFLMCTAINHSCSNSSPIAYADNSNQNSGWKQNSAEIAKPVQTPEFPRASSQNYRDVKNSQEKTVLMKLVQKEKQSSHLNETSTLTQELAKLQIDKPGNSSK